MSYLTLSGKYLPSTESGPDDLDALEPAVGNTRNVVKWRQKPNLTMRLAESYLEQNPPLRHTPHMIPLGFANPHWGLGLQDKKMEPVFQDPVPIGEEVVRVQVDRETLVKVDIDVGQGLDASEQRELLGLGQLTPPHMRFLKLSDGSWLPSYSFVALQEGESGRELTVIAASEGTGKSVVSGPALYEQCVNRVNRDKATFEDIEIIHTLERQSDGKIYRLRQVVKDASQKVFTVDEVMKAFGITKEMSEGA